MKYAVEVSHLYKSYGKPEAGKSGRKRFISFGKAGIERCAEVEHAKNAHEGMMHRTQAVLKDCSFQVPAGSFTAIIGKSGCGKTTLLNCICGLLEWDAGEIEVQGQKLSALSDKQLCLYRQEKIGIVFQFFNLLEEQTVLENIRMVFDLTGRVYDAAFVEQILDILELTDKKDCLPAELSGGEQQRAAIARALAGKPAVLIADEPTGNLDQKSSRDLVAFLRKCQHIFSQTILMVTHDPDIAGNADYVFSMQDGHIDNVQRGAS